MDWCQNEQTLNETIESFIWLFKIFLAAASDKHSNTICIDQDATMGEAIAYVFWNTSLIFVCGTPMSMLLNIWDI
jgi:hypothetical protein